MPSPGRLQELTKKMGPLLLVAALVVTTYAMRTVKRNSITPRLEWDDHGTKRALVDLRGNVVLVHFWATWCQPCLKEMPELAELESAFAREPFELVAIHVGPADRIPFDYLPRYPKTIIWNMPEAALNEFDVTAIPVTYIIDKAGTTRSVVHGPQEWSSENMRSSLIKLIGEERVLVERVVN